MFLSARSPTYPQNVFSERHITKYAQIPTLHYYPGGGLAASRAGTLFEFE